MYPSLLIKSVKTFTGFSFNDFLNFFKNSSYSSYLRSNSF